MHKVSTYHTKTSSQKTDRDEKHNNTTTTKSEHIESNCASLEDAIAVQGESAHNSTGDRTNLELDKLAHRQDSKDSDNSVAAAATGLLNIVTPQRQRSSDSLTLSSSYSDGEVTSSEGASGSSTGAQGGGAKKGVAKTAGPGSKAGKKSNKQTKKAKKVKKKEQSVKERSEKSQRRRAHVLQRIRKDSLNTSSDEENSLTPVIDLPSPVDRNFPTGLAESSSPEKEYPGDVRDPEKVRVDLKRRILSKKPPAHFETPATEPVFHDVSDYQYCIVNVGAKKTIA